MILKHKASSIKMPFEEKNEQLYLTLPLDVITCVFLLSFLVLLIYVNELSSMCL